MGKKAQIWVHPNIKYMGGEFTEETERTYFGSDWDERVHDALSTFDGDSIAITTYERGAENYEDGAWDDASWGDHVKRPYGEDRWDEVIEDPNYGRVVGLDPDATHTDRSGLTRERLERWAREYDQIVVRGGYWGDCEERFVDQLAEIAEETGTEITVDAGNSFEKYRGLVKIDQDDEPDEREKERKRADDTDTAAEYFGTDHPDFAPADEYEHVHVANLSEE